MIKIRELEQLGEDFEILWFAGFESTSEGAWSLRAILIGAESGRIEMNALPIGLFPVLTLGRRFSKGRLLETAAVGEIVRINIGNLGGGTEVSSREVTEDLYSFRGHAGGVQRLVRYRAGGTEVLVPTIELVRYLFAHNKTMSNALMQPSGLMQLCVAVPPGFYDKLCLEFTEATPERVLSDDFVREFAWLFVHPDGRKCWDSVRAGTLGRNFVSIMLPPVTNCDLTFRGVRSGDRWLALEIIAMSGRTLPCSELYCLHPALGAPEAGRQSDGLNGSANGMKQENAPSGDFHIEYVIRGNSRESRSHGRQKLLPGPLKWSAFENRVAVRRIRRPAPLDQESDSIAARAHSHAFAEGPHKKRKRVSIPASVADEAHAGDLPPVEFKILEAEDSSYRGKLDRLLKAFAIVKAMVPDTAVHASFCRLKEGRRFSMLGQKRRICLVAIIRPSGLPPRVLLDVDHAEIGGLSSLLIRYLGNPALERIEFDVKRLLDRAVDRGGRWDSQLEASLGLDAHCERWPRLMRASNREDESRYLTVWAIRLKNALHSSFKTHLSH